MNDGPAISVVTVCMNRRHHLLRSAAALAAWPHHREHLVVDWSSSAPLVRDHLPADPRIRLLRVEGETRWNPSLAYNFALRQAQCPWLMRMDADCWPTADFDPTALLSRGSIWVGEGGEGRFGQFLISREWFERVGGFNEYMRGWGFEDKDLRFRLQIQHQQVLHSLPDQAIAVIEHSDAERMGQSRRSSVWHQHRSLATLRASRLHNRLVAAHCPWGREVPASQYVPVEGLDAPAPPRWTLRQQTRPCLPAAVERKLEQARRRCFWGTLLVIPELAIDVLPERLLPADRDGQWKVRWWHRLYGLTLARVLMLPVHALGLFRGLLGTKG
jgi:GT2 family glycosyltransferase